jgi:hypothetical protein
MVLARQNTLSFAGNGQFQVKHKNICEELFFYINISLTGLIHLGCGKTMLEISIQYPANSRPAYTAMRSNFPDNRYTIAQF